MHVNWSIILNVLLLGGVIFALAQIIRKKNDTINREEHASGSESDSAYDSNEDVISVRKLSDEPATESVEQVGEPSLNDSKERAATEQNPAKKTTVVQPDADSLLMFLLAKRDKQLSGYELLQNILASGLRFGEGHIFHRHQHANGQGRVMFSLAAATPTGVFDLQNIGAFHVRGLCFFMKPCNDQAVDLERFEMMLETAQHLSDSLDTHLLDARRRPLNEDSVSAYRAQLHEAEMLVD